MEHITSAYGSLQENSQENNAPTNPFENYDYPVKHKMRELLDAAIEKDDAHIARRPKSLPRLAERGYVEPFPVHLLGPILQPAAEAIAETVECVPDIAAQSVLAAASLAVCPHFDIKLPYGETKPTSLFVLTVGRSSDRKTAADKFALRAVTRWEKELAFRYKRDIGAYDVQFAKWSQRRKELWEDDSLSPVQREQQIGPEPRKPAIPMLRCDDPTVEGLRDLYIRGAQVLALFGDEGGKFIGGHSMKVEQRLNAIGSLSTMWEASPIKKVRAGAGNFATVESYRLAAHLMMQPGIAEDFLGNELYREQGVLSRFLVSWPDLEQLDGKRFEDKEPAPEHLPAMSAYNERLFSILSYPLPENERRELAPVSVSFSTGARELWKKFKNDSQPYLEPNGPWYPVRGFAEKGLEHAARIAVCLQMFNGAGSTELEADWFEAGWQLVIYYVEQLLSMRDIVNDPDLVRADLLYRWLDQEFDYDHISTSVLLTRGPKSLRNKATLDRIIKLLEEEYHLLEPAHGGNVETDRGEQYAKRRWKIHRGF